VAHGVRGGLSYTARRVSARRLRAAAGESAGLYCQSPKFKWSAPSSTVRQSSAPRAMRRVDVAVRDDRGVAEQHRT
jgi:hypothetical protein